MTNVNQGTVNVGTPLYKGLSKQEQQLKMLDGGKLYQRLLYVRDRCVYLAPSEIYLLVNPADVRSTAMVFFLRGVRSIERFRNILVLVPLLLTWLGLCIAAVAYEETIAIVPQQIQQPFLKMWVEGFPVIKHPTVVLPLLGFALPPEIIRFFAFGDVALLDAMFFLCMIILTWRAQRIEAHGYKLAADLSNWVQDELFQLEQHSTVVRSANNERDIALNRLSDLLAEMRNVVTTFNAAMQQQSQGLTELLGGTRHIATAVDELNTIFQRGEETYDKLDKTLPALGENINRMTESQDKSTEALQNIAENVVTTTQSIEALARPFMKADLNRLAKDVQDQHQQMLRDNTTILQRQEVVTQQISGVASKIGALKPPSPQPVGFWRRLLGR